MAPPDISDKTELYREFILLIRELILELRSVKVEVARFNATIEAISKKAGNIAMIQNLLNTFLNPKK